MTMWRRLAMVWLMVMVGMALFGELLAPYDPMTIYPDAIAQTPNHAHPLGTDGLGRDLFSRLLAGAGRTLGVTFGATILAMSLGALLGICAPMLGRFGDSTLLLIINSLLALPSLLMALMMLTVLGRSEASLIMAVGIGQIGMVAQVLRGATWRILAEEYIVGARALGAGWLRIALVHVRLGIAPTLWAQMGVIFCYCLFNSTALNFLGVGVGIGVPEWGIILAEGREVFRTAPHVALFSGLLLMSVVIATTTLMQDDYGISNR